MSRDAVAEFETTVRVRFEHVDPVGIVFYPRYVDIIHQVFEDWFEQGLGVDYHRFHLVERRAIPLVDLHVRFQAPSLLGDVLRFRLGVSRLGRRSLALRVRADCAGEARLEATMELVHARRVEAGVTSADIPPSMATAIERFRTEGEETPPG